MKRDGNPHDSQDTFYRFALLAALLLGFAVTLAVPATAQTTDPQGFLYGEVKTESGKTYKGRLRWDDEEAFWGDFFNSSKEERPYLEEVDRRDRRDRGRRNEVRIFGIRIGGWDSYGDGRSFVARFGDIERIDLGRGDHAFVTMKSGTKYEVDGGSNDIGADIFVWDSEIGEIELDWDRIESIRFLPTPVDLAVPVHRLHGKMKTRIGDFEGYIQWDQEECLSTDELDGETPDGDVSIEMGKLRSIARHSRRSSLVTLRNGREMELDGTNDVDDDNRGIYVEDPRYGRVLVDWDSFERLDFSEPGPSGPAYEDFHKSGPLQGTVTDRDGKKHSGRIVYDIDEAETWEILNGEWRDVEFSIPFSLIRSIIPESSDSSRVILKGGEELELEDQADVGDGNDGVLILTADDAKPIYVEWDDVRRIDFD